MSQSEENEMFWVPAVLLAWMVPGLGHWYLGRRGKAVTFFVGITGLFVAGWALGQWRVVNHEEALPFIGQVLCGTPALVATWVRQRLEGSANPVPVGFESGFVYTLVAGLLNLLVMLDAYIVANNIRRPTHGEPEAEEN